MLFVQISIMQYIFIDKNMLSIFFWRMYLYVSKYLMLNKPFDITIVQSKVYDIDIKNMESISEKSRISTRWYNRS